MSDIVERLRGNWAHLGPDDAEDAADEIERARHFIHDHLEQVEVRIDGINEELRALHTVMRQVLLTFDRMVEVMDRAVANDERDDG